MAGAFASISYVSRQPGRPAPSNSPSGLIIFSGDRFPAWRGNVFLGALSGLDLRRLELQNGRVTHEEVFELLARGARRIRDVRQGADGCCTC